MRLVDIIRRWVCAVVIGLLISVGQWFSQAFDDAHELVLRIGARKGIG